MIYRIDPQVFDLLPGLVRGVVAATGVENRPSYIEELDHLLRETARGIAAGGAVALGHPRITEWERAYAAFPNAESREVADLVAAYCGGKTTIFLLTEDGPSISP